MRYILTFLVCCLFVGCRTVSPVERDLERKVIFAPSQTLLRDVIAGLNEDVETEVRIGTRLTEVADLAITHLPKREQEGFIPLGVALDILRMQAVFQYQVNADWKIQDESILFFFAGDEDAYKKLRKRD